MPPPIDPSSPPAGGSSVLGGVLSALPLVGGMFNAFEQGYQNRKNRDFALDMYNRERSDALADWNMQNTYNSPAAQMERLKAAGLNPNLVYGNGVVANSPGMPRSATMGSYHGEAPQIDTSVSTQGLFFGTDMAIKRQQLDNLRTANAMMMSNIMNKNADTTLKEANTGNRAFDLEFKQTNMDVNTRIREQMLSNLSLQHTIGTSQAGLNLFNLDFARQAAGDRLAAIHQGLLNDRQMNILREAANARQEEQNTALLKIRAQTVLNMLADNAKTVEEAARIRWLNKLTSTETDIKKIDLYLKQAGFNWTDPVLIRQLRMQYPK